MKKSAIILLILIILVGFYKIGEYNYTVFKEIKKKVVHHPESLPNSTLAKTTSFGYQNVKADFYRLQAIQYIGGNALSAEYKKYLYKLLDLITDLNPYFEGPYFIGELLLPTYNYRYENLSEKQKDIYTQQGKKIGLKGIANMCDREKLELIKKEFDLEKLWKVEKYTQPCTSFKVPYFLAYLFYFSFHKPETSAYFYKVSSAMPDAYEGAKIMAAIMQGKSGDREKSVYMFLNLSRSIDREDVQCLQFSKEIEQYLSERNMIVDGKLVKVLRDTSLALFGEFNEEEEIEALSDSKCSTYANKAIREINMLYLEQANTKYFKATGKYAKEAKELFENGYIDTIPQDFQFYKKLGYGVDYIFNENTKKFDYEVNYPE